MNYSFTSPNLLVLLITGGLLAFLALMLQKISRHENGVFLRPPMRFSIFYIGMIALFCIAALAGFFENFTSMPPRALAIFMVIIATTVFLLTQKVDGRLAFLKAVPIHWLIYIQAFRILVEIALIGLNREGLVPEQLTWEGRNMDIVVGGLALQTGYLAQKKTIGGVRAGIAFNVIGLVSLVNIASIALLSFPTPFRVYDMVLLPVYFPGVLVPVLFVAFAIYIHILSLKQLIHILRKKREESPQTAQ